MMGFCFFASYYSNFYCRGEKLERVTFSSDWSMFLKVKSIYFWLYFLESTWATYFFQYIIYLIQTISRLTEKLIVAVSCNIVGLGRHERILREGKCILYNNLSRTYCSQMDLLLAVRLLTRIFFHIHFSIDRLMYWYFNSIIINVTYVGLYKDKLILAKLHASWFHRRTRLLKYLLIYLVTRIRSCEWRRTFLQISIERAVVPICVEFSFSCSTIFSRCSRFSFVSCLLQTIFEITSHPTWRYRMKICKVWNVIY